MRKLHFLFLFLFAFSVLSAQEKLSKEEKARREKNIQAGNPFVKYGSKAPVATLSKGKYLEVQDLDSIVTIGTSRWHVDNKKIVSDIVRDTLNPDAQPIGDAPGMWMSPDPLTEEFPSYSPYNFCMGNPLRLVDTDGRAPTDIVFFNRQGQETNRIISNTVFKTYVQDNNVNFMRPYLFYAEAQMPNVIQNRVNNNGGNEDVSGSQYQKNDYQIAASTYLTNQELNSGFMNVVDRGGHNIPSSNLVNVPDISVDTVKAWSMQETHAGTDLGGSGILQVNVAGDHTADKSSLGITKGSVFSANSEINLAIRYAIGKGFSSDGKGNYTWKGWDGALKGFGPGAKDPNYVQKINTMQSESTEPTPTNYKP